MKSRKRANGIGSLNEKPLHVALKNWCAGPKDRVEVSVDGFVIDIVQGGLLVEIQTASFASIKRKLLKLVDRHRVRLLYPVAREKWIVKLPADGAGTSSRRKSPKRGGVLDVFGQLVSFPDLLAHPNFSLMVVLIREEEVRKYDGARGWRRKGWVTHERRLIDVVDHRLFESPHDFAALIPAELDEPFTTEDLANASGRTRSLAQKMAYCLRGMGAIARAGKRGNAHLYMRAVPSAGALKDAG